MAIIRRVLFNKEQNELSQLKYLSYSTYNKATFSPEEVEKTNKSLHKAFKFFSQKFIHFKEDQHFLMIESVTEKKIYNKNHFKETITGAKSTILDVPSLFVQTTQLQSFSPYSDFVSIGGKTYVGPLANHTLTRYAFSMLDTIHKGTDTIYVIKYNAFPKKQFDGLKGLLYINSKNYAVQHFTASSRRERKLKMNAYQSYTFYPEHNVWFPSRTKTTAMVDKSGEIFVVTLDSYLSDLTFNSFTRKKDYDETVLEYPEYASRQDETFWKEKRKVPLTPVDENTYLHYDSIDQKKFIQRTLKFGENLYYNFITYEFLDIDLNKILNINQLEGIRIGFGAHTNEKFSEVFKAGGYIGYGFRDTETKYGCDFTFRPRRQIFYLHTDLSDDVQEAGGVFFPFNRSQYSSEPLRRIRMRIMDRVFQWENSINIHPLKFLDTKIALNISQHETTYDYQFADETDNLYSFTEVKLGIRYAYSEQAMQLLSRKIPLGSKFPVFYFQYTRGLNDLFGGDYSYQKYDAKAEYNFKLLDFGKTGIQIAGGVVDGTVPYTKLYNGKGSWRNPSPVIQNSFETMRYNEFLSDRYISFFISHNFGRLYFKTRYIRPSILLIHNVGFGTLKNPEAHKKIDFKTMEKGYVESGLLLDNIFIFRVVGLKIGLGAGCFLRYGPYANDKFRDNIVFKFSFKFSI